MRRGRRANGIDTQSHMGLRRRNVTGDLHPAQSEPWLEYTAALPLGPHVDGVYLSQNVPGHFAVLLLSLSELILLGIVSRNKGRRRGGEERADIPQRSVPSQEQSQSDPTAIRSHL